MRPTVEFHDEPTECAGCAELRARVAALEDQLAKAVAPRCDACPAVAVIMTDAGRFCARHFVGGAGGVIEGPWR